MNEELLKIIARQLAWSNIIPLGLIERSELIEKIKAIKNSKIFQDKMTLIDLERELKDIDKTIDTIGTYCINDINFTLKKKKTKKS